MIGIIISIIILLFSLQFKSVQTAVIQQVAQYFSRELNTDIKIKGFYFKPFSSLTFQEVYIPDQQGDTLLYVDELAAQLDLHELRSGLIRVNKIDLHGGDVYLKRAKGGTYNFTYIIDYFNQPKKKKDQASTFEIRLDEVVLQDVHVKYRNQGKALASKGIDFNDIEVQGLSGHFTGIDFDRHLLKTAITNLHFREKSGFVLKRLDALATIDSSAMIFNQLGLQTNSSYLGDYLSFSYPKFSSFSDFINTVEVKARMVHTQITAHDIAYFAPSISTLTFKASIEGQLQGKVKSFSGNNLTIKSGKATYFKGNARVVGLPDIDATLFDVHVNQLASNKQDTEELVASFSERRNFKLPELLTSLGHVNYTGSFKGRYNNFDLNGTLQTVLGEIKTDFALDVVHANAYQGTVASNGFDLGRFLASDDLGRVVFDAEVNGTGFDPDSRNTVIAATINSLFYKGYNYQHIQLDIKETGAQFAGEIDLVDPNLKMSMVGDVDLGGSDPHYDLDAKVDWADLNKIGLIKDTISVAGVFKAAVKGRELNNMTGELTVLDLALKKPKISSKIDSIRLLISGEAAGRTVSLYSDLADATIHGEMDLEAFPDYFKSIAQRYIPSWREELNPGKQIFDFSLQLKRAEPLTAFFVPLIQIPDTLTLNGRFSTVDNQAALNGYIPLLQIGKLKVKDIILDETATQESLDLTITADQLNLTDSLYVKNINVSNRLDNDSLNFNVKLSDVDARNQLDLNGLIEFSQHGRAMLSLLPSNVLINEEDWALEEKVNFGFQNGGIKIAGFQLANGLQRVLVDGLVSGNEQDMLHVTFEQFSLATLDGLTKPLGIGLKGELNGEFQILSLLKNPYISADITSSDIFYNEREIGDMVLKAEMDPRTDLVGVNMEIERHDLQTLKITGTYDVDADENSLDLQAHLEDSEVVLFEPFLKKLVSNLSGTISANIVVRGTPLSPAISGECLFHKTAFTINYLKTRYTIDDKVSIKNSAIALNDLVITDVADHKAIANGRVDMSNPLDPNIEVDVKATDFMVLNTTAKDNALYYGTAYGSGDFKFKGPTSNMAIDIVASTSDGTVFNIPLNASGRVSDQDFITFVSKDSILNEPRQSYLDGLTLHIELGIGRNAEANIFTDMGKLSGVGTGNITMDITSLGDFEMFGDYVIGQGKFTFTAQDFINKIFEISRGGTIRWTGNPAEALINLTAVYEVRTSVRPLYNAAGRAGTDQRVVAQAEMILAGNLTHPDISFGLNFPTDAYVKDELQSYFSDANNINQQALSLIVRRSFAPGTGTDLTTELNSTVLSAGTELAFNQLNNVISQSLNLNFVDFNIRSLNEASASIRLLRNRLVLTGGVTDRRSELNDFNVFSNQVASDVEAIYLIRKDGSLLFRASNRLNNRNFLNPNEDYVSALGLVYRKEFDTLGEFFRHMFMINRKKEEEGTTPDKGNKITTENK